MNNLKYFIDKYNLTINKTTIKKNITIINTNIGNFIFKKNTDIKIYNYLLSRGFDYFPKIIDYNDEYIMFDYIDNIDYDLDQKASDYIKVLSLLHSKTIYYKNIENNDYKTIYEDLYNKLVDINNYYNNLINIIETKVYMSPSEYLISRNISNIFLLINNSFKELEEWYKLVKNNNRKRICTIYNNDLNSVIKSTDNIYFTDFSKSNLDSPIIDLYNFYNKYNDKFDIESLISKYEHTLKLLPEEKKLLYIYIMIPNKIIISNDIKDMNYIKKEITRLYKIIIILNSKEEECTGTHQKEDDKK